MTLKSGTNPPAALPPSPIAAPICRSVKASEKLGAILWRRGLAGQMQGAVGVYYDDPNAIPAQICAAMRGRCCPRALPSPTGLTTCVFRLGAMPVRASGGHTRGCRRPMIICSARGLHSLRGSGGCARDRSLSEHTDGYRPGRSADRCLYAPERLTGQLSSWPKYSAGVRAQSLRGQALIISACRTITSACRIEAISTSLPL